MSQNAHFTGEKLLDLLRVKPGDFADHVIAPGPRDRLNILLEMIERPDKLFDIFGNIAYTGEYRGTKVSVCSGGMYAPEAAIGTEIFCAAGVKNIIRTGSAGAVGEGVGIGDIVIATGCLRGDGVTSNYVPDGYASVADHAVVLALAEAAESLGIGCQLGHLATTDAMLRETPEFVARLQDANILAIDMATSPVLCISHINKRRAGCIVAISDDLKTGELGFMSPGYYDAEMNILRIALEAVKRLDGNR